MALNYLLVVEDGGELKTLSRAEFEQAIGIADDGGLEIQPHLIDETINRVLDERAIAAGEYDPADNDTPMVFTR